jgi:hypothetical protein
VLHETFRQQKWSWMPSRSCRPRGQPVRVCAASSDAPAQGDARRAPLHAQALRRRESAAAIQARRYAPEKKQACEVRAYGNAAVAAAAATEATCALDIVVTRRCRAHLCVPRGNPEARGGLCQCHHNSSEQLSRYRRSATRRVLTNTRTSHPARKGCTKGLNEPRLCGESILSATS